MLLDAHAPHEVAEAVAALLREEELLKLLYAETPALIRVKHFEELEGVLLAHLHAVLLEHVDDLPQFQLARVVLVEVLEDLNDVLVALDFVLGQHRLRLSLVLAALLEPLDNISISEAVDELWLLISGSSERLIRALLTRGRTELCQ